MKSKKISKTEDKEITVYVSHDGKEFESRLQCEEYDLAFYTEQIKDIPVHEYCPPKSEYGIRHVWYYVSSHEQIALIEHYYNFDIDASETYDQFDMVCFDIIELKAPVWISVFIDDGQAYSGGTLDDYLRDVQEFTGSFPSFGEPASDDGN